MNEIAEFSAAKRVVAEILDHGASVGISVSRESGHRKGWILLEEKGLNLVSPEQVNDFVVRRNTLTGLRCTDKVRRSAPARRRRAPAPRTGAPVRSEGSWLNSSKS